MINKITQKIETNYANKVVRAVYQRGLQTIKVTSAYINDKLYFRKWIISEYKHQKQISQSYNANNPIKNSKHIIDLYL